MSIIVHIVHMLVQLHALCTNLQLQGSAPSAPARLLGRQMLPCPASASSSYSETWVKAKYAGIETPCGSLQSFCKQQDIQRTAKMRVKELLFSSFMVSVTCLCREHWD